MDQSETKEAIKATAAKLAILKKELEVIEAEMKDTVIDFILSQYDFSVHNQVYAELHLGGDYGCAKWIFKDGDLGGFYINLPAIVDNLSDIPIDHLVATAEKFIQ